MRLSVVLIACVGMTLLVATASYALPLPAAFDDAVASTRFAAASGTLSDSATLLTWDQTVSPTGVPCSVSSAVGSAQRYCADNTRGGYRDWRLPSVLEVQSLFDYRDIGSVHTATDPSVPVATMPSLFQNIPRSTDSPEEARTVWALEGNGTFCRSFDVGYGTSSGRGGAGDDLTLRRVMCVRGAARQVAFVDQYGRPLASDSTQVLDTSTNLVWQRTTSSSPHPYDPATPPSDSSAQRHCATLDLYPNGPGAWRLPTIKELTSVILMSVAAASAPSLPDAFLVGSPTTSWWASSPFVASTNSTKYDGQLTDGKAPMKWLVLFASADYNAATGYLISTTLSLPTAFVLCVRDPSATSGPVPPPSSSATPSESEASTATMVIVATTPTSTSSPTTTASTTTASSATPPSVLARISGSKLLGATALAAAGAAGLLLLVAAL